jgi:hypothetical protein
MEKVTTLTVGKRLAYHGDDPVKQAQFMWTERHHSLRPARTMEREDSAVTS